MQSRIAALLILIGICVVGYADEYIIHRIWGKGNITVSFKNAYEGMVFKDTAIIRCKVERTGMEVINVTKQKENIQDGVVFSSVVSKGNAVSINEYRKLYAAYEKEKTSSVLPRRSLHSKGFTNADQMLFLLRDSVTVVNTGYFQTNARLEAVWKNGDKEYRTPLSYSADRRRILVTSNIFCNQNPCFVELRLEVTDDLGGPYLLKTIWIEPIE